MDMAGRMVVDKEKYVGIKKNYGVICCACVLIRVDVLLGVIT